MHVRERVHIRERVSQELQMSAKNLHDSKAMSANSANIYPAPAPAPATATANANANATTTSNGLPYLPL